MVIAGIQKSSLIDFPGKVSCVLFLQGCNFHCPYCHNPSLVKIGGNSGHLLPESMIYDFLDRRRGFLDGVVISGGEPTIHDDLIELLKKIKKMGYAVKLDTNGSRPKVLEKLISEGLLDYIAMDIKTSPFHYQPTFTGTCNPERILSSIRLIMESGVAFEFRTTCVKPLLDHGRMEAILSIIEGARLYVLQRFRHREVLMPKYFKKGAAGYDENELLRFKSMAASRVSRCFIR
jgi:pyruvate formate lyase activating enzyme